MPRIDILSATGNGTLIHLQNKRTTITTTGEGEEEDEEGEWQATTGASNKRRKESGIKNCIESALKIVHHMSLRQAHADLKDQVGFLTLNNFQACSFILT